MFNLSTLSGINLKTDNYFQYTSNVKAFLRKRPYVSFTLLFHGLIVLGKSSFTRFLVQGWEVVSGLLHNLYYLVE